MASEDDFTEDTFAAQEGNRSYKKRRLPGACDICRKKKIRCDSAHMPGNRCSNCIAFNSECTHTARIKERESQKGYIKILEERVNKMEKMLRTLCSPEDIDQAVGGLSPENLSSPDSAPHSAYPELKYPTPQSLPSLKPTASTSAAPTDDLQDADDDFGHIALAEHLHRLSLEAAEDRFFGQSSAFMFVKHATNIKEGYTGNPNISGNNFRRPIYWSIRPWERAYAESEEAHYVYPDSDLLATLVGTYFTRINILLPVLHRPTFEKSVADNLHLRDPRFGATLLLVCAVASRFSADSRVLVDDSESELSCGWKYFEQVPVVRKVLFHKASVYDVQYYCLAILYLLGTSVPHTAWNLLGLGLRFAQERGAHRRKPDGQKPTVEDESWKRAFWCLISLDRLLSSFLGRPCAVQDEDFDVDFPIECDDEYWVCADLEMSFKQPPGKPSHMSYFNSHLKLCEILAYTLRTLYSTKKAKTLSGLVGDQWEQRVVTELDSAMNKWADSVPSHLRWDPTREDDTFFHQSALLHAVYYHLQIQIHRPFLQKTSPLSFPSLAICTNAARSCSHVLDTQVKRTVIPMPHVIMAAFSSGIVLLLNIWGGRRTGLSMSPTKEKTDVQKCMDVLRFCERRWHVAGRLCDMLVELACMRDFPQQKENPPSNKRSRDAKDDAPEPVQPITATSVSSASFSMFPAPEPTGPTALRRRVSISTPILSPPARHGTLPPNTRPNESGNYIAGNQWDLSDLLFAQIAYSQLPQSNTSPPNDGQASAEFPQLPLNDYQSRLQSIPIGHAQNAPDYTGPSEIMGGDSTMSMWLNAPTAFNMDEWETYIASVSEHPMSGNNDFGAFSFPDSG